MLHITRFVVNMINENCYLLHDDTNEAVLIDCGALYPEEHKAISDFITEHGLKLTHLFNTHAHFDHLFGANYIYRTYGTKVELCRDEVETYEAAEVQMNQFMNLNLTLSLPPLGNTFADGDTLHFGHTDIKVIETPGHTPGGVCFYIESEKVLISGDSLFRREIGRCDLPGGNEASLIKALREKVLTLPNEVKVLPGHGQETTIAYEREYNYYLQ